MILSILTLVKGIIDTNKKLHNHKGGGGAGTAGAGTSLSGASKPSGAEGAKVQASAVPETQQVQYCEAAVQPAQN